ncbi:MAG: DNA/RNA non-specific endonuclease [Parachlamydiaceae bacterium]|nr:DNA/RNA non-specific endonuclease [Parachlamydiaceae bacterium]
MDRSYYSLEYDCRTRNPVWVYEKLTADNLHGNASRSKHQFREDTAIPEIFRSTLKDYLRAGFDRHSRSVHWPAIFATRRWRKKVHQVSSDWPERSRSTNALL